MCLSGLLLHAVYIFSLCTALNLLNIVTLIVSDIVTDIELHRITCFLWSICNGCGMPAGNSYPTGQLVPSPVFGLAYDQIVETNFPNLPCLF